MSRVFINHVGISAERCLGTRQLAELVNAEPVEPIRANVYASPSISLSKAALSTIDREDRSTLGPLATGTLNAIADALGGRDLTSLREAMHVYTGSDSAEHSFTALFALMRHHTTCEALLEHIGEIRNHSNPLNMMRLLSTNPLYHASKRLDAHGGGYPVRAMSLSGLCALEDAWRAVANGRAPEGAAVIAAGNMRSFDALAAFGKMGLLHGLADAPQVDPTHGAAAVLIGLPGAGSAPLAELLDVDTMFRPEPFAVTETWSTLFERTRRRLGVPDVIVAYRNGAHLLNKTEDEALELHYPGVSIRSYKPLLGYTGKPNNLLDLAAVLVDRSVPVGAVVMINGTGFGWGVGTISLRKMAGPTLH